MVYIRWNTMDIFRHTIAPILGICVACSMSCGPKGVTVTNARYSAILSGRQVHIDIVGKAICDKNKDKVIVSVKDNVIAVWRDRVLVDGVVIGRLPEVSSVVCVNISPGHITVTADKVPVVSKALNK